MNQIEQPIQNIDKIDILGKRIDGGLDLIVTVSSPLIDCGSHREILRKKVETYVSAISAPDFLQNLKLSKQCDIRVLIVSDYPVDRSMRDFVKSLDPILETVGATLKLTTSDDQWGAGGRR